MRLHFKPMSYQSWVHRALFSSLVLMGWLGHPLAGPLVDKATSAGGSKPSLIRVEKGVVSVKLAGAALEEVLREICAQSRIRLILDGSRPETVSADLQAVPLDEALRTLIQQNFLLRYGTDGQLLEVRILGRDPLQSPPSGESGSLDSRVLELQREEAEQRGREVLALGELQDEGATELVIGALKGDEDPEMRQRAVWALEDLGGQRAITALTEAVSGDSDGSVRQRAVEALAKIGGEETIEPLTWALRDDPEPLVRYEALVHLAELGGERMTGPLYQALNDPDELVWAKAEEILQMRGAGDHEQ